MKEGRCNRKTDRREGKGRERKICPFSLIFTPTPASTFVCRRCQAYKLMQAMITHYVIRMYRYYVQAFEFNLHPIQSVIKTYLNAKTNASKNKGNLQVAIFQTSLANIHFTHTLQTGTNFCIFPPFRFKVASNYPALLRVFLSSNLLVKQLGLKLKEKC